MALKAITRFQLLHGQNFPPHDVLAFIRQQLPLRTKLVREVLGQISHKVAANTHAHTSFEDCVGRAEALSFEDESVVADAQDTLNDLIDTVRNSHSPAFLEHSKSLEAQELLNALQYSWYSIRTLLAHYAQASDRHSWVGLRKSSCVQSFNAADLAVLTVEYIKPFCVEKFGVSPEINIDLMPKAMRQRSSTQRSRLPFSVVGVPEYAGFIYTELLKNAVAGMIAHFGAANVDDAPPIRLQLVEDAHLVTTLIHDTAGGSKRHPPGATTAFSYTLPIVEAAREPTYQYSRDFGAPFSGMGLGLIRSALHARHFGGRLALLNTPGYGCIAQAVFERTGVGGDDLYAVGSMAERP